jgi:hypothetical protein
MDNRTKLDIMLAAAEARNMQFFFADEYRESYRIFLEQPDDYKQTIRAQANQQLPIVSQESIDKGIKEMLQLIETYGEDAVDKMLSDVLALEDQT